MESSQGTVSSIMYTFFMEGDQSTRSGLKVVVAISEGNTSCLPMSASIFQSRAGDSWLLSDGVELLLVAVAPSRTKAVAHGVEVLGFGSARVLLLARFSSSVAARLFRTWL